MSTKIKDNYCVACGSSPPSPSKRLKIKCAYCKQDYHIQCVNIKIETYKDLSRVARTSWKCSTCINVTTRRKGDNNNNPMSARRPATLDDSNMSIDEITHLDPSGSGSRIQEPIPITDNLTLNSIAELLDSKFKSFRESFFSDMKSFIRSEINSAIEKTKQKFTETTGFLQSENKDIKASLSVVETHISELEKQNCNYLKNITNLQNHLESIEKVTRNRNVEIQAVPEKRNKNVLAIVKNLYKTLSLQINDDEVSSCHRVAKLPSTSASRPRNILVSLLTIRYRDKLISTVKRFNKANPRDRIRSVHLGVAGHPTIREPSTCHPSARNSIRLLE
ncbi:unnamed protein product [Parnassius mnemosyne]|uniref:PHD-type domain-containing protein n=1 Tax=Parnassius mnemosyne TaxID=213953 RepID=A0AAV1LYB8_9NEOP